MRVIEAFVKYVPRDKIHDDAEYFVQDSYTYGNYNLSQHRCRPYYQDGFKGSWGAISCLRGTLVNAPLSIDAEGTVVTRKELMRAYYLTEKGYTLWFGGECPVDELDMVDIVLSVNNISDSDTEGFEEVAHDVDWGLGNVDSNVIAYKLSEDATSEIKTCTKNDMPVSGEKHDSQKPRFSLVPAEALSDVIDVLEFGAQKYGAENWREVDNAQERYFNAAMRHLLAWRKGELSDDESGLPHLAHAATCLMFMIEGDKK